MTIQRLAMWAYCFGILLFLTFPATAQRITSPLNQNSYTRQAVLTKLAQAQVVYLGETHDSPQDHQAQLDILRSLHRLRNRPLAVALEMFQHPYQPALDRYLKGELTEAELQDQSQYQQRWGFPWEYYAPVLRFARENKLPLLALNTPTEITQKVARLGFKSLTPAEQQLIPPLTEIDTDNLTYRQLLLQTYQDFHKDKGSIKGFEQFFQAQVLWDETMAAAIAHFLRTNPGYQVVVLAGQGHIAHGYGIPSRVARRLAATWKKPQGFTQAAILLNPSEEAKADDTQSAADYFWYSP